MKYSGANWYPGDKEGKGGVFFSSPKRALCRQPLQGLGRHGWRPALPQPGSTPAASRRRLCGQILPLLASPTVTRWPTPARKMIHTGKRTPTFIVTKGISAGREELYRGLVYLGKQADEAPQPLTVRLSADRRSRSTYLPLCRSVTPLPSSSMRRPLRSGEDQPTAANGIRGGGHIALIVGR